MNPAFASSPAVDPLALPDGPVIIGGPETPRSRALAAHGARTEALMELAGALADPAVYGHQDKLMLVCSAYDPAMDHRWLTDLEQNAILTCWKRALA